jgi:hypothetical protein
MKTRQYVCALLFVAVALVAIAQSPTGTIQGLVRDASNAVVPNAVVRIKNVATNEAKELRTDAQGRYVQPFLLPGTYTVDVEMKGFRPARQEEIKLDVAQNRSVDFILEIGAVSQEVRVEATPLPLDVNTSSVGQLIENKRILDLPLNGRNPLSLVWLSAGVSGAGSGSTPNIAGGRSASNEVQIDGSSAVITTTYPGVLEFAYSPQVDSVQEYSVQVNGISAEYGRTGGAVVNLVTKTGTNAFHGSAYNFLRNSQLDANSFFANKAGVAKGSFKRNQWGVTLGGPVVIPGLYNGRDKTFFFVGYEGLSQRTQSVYTYTVPTAAWRAGDFSNLRTSSGAAITIYDPLTVRADPANPGRYIRSPVAGNQIPVERRDPVAVNVMGYFPTANTAPGNPYTNLNNYVFVGAQPSSSMRIDPRIDHNRTNRWRMFVRTSYVLPDSPGINPFGAGNPGTPLAGMGRDSITNTVMDHTLTLSPTVIASVRYSFVRMSSLWYGASKNFDLAKLGFPKYFSDLVTTDGGGFTPMSFSSAVSGIGNASSIVAGRMTHTLTANVTKVMSRHTIKSGLEMRSILLNYYQPASAAGSFSFSAGWTQQEISTTSSVAGFPLASFLLGLPASGSKSHDIAVATSSPYWAGYVQDDWKASRKLTLNLGLRYDVTLPRTERFNNLSYFDMYERSPIAGQVPASACPSCGNLLGAMHFVDASHRRQVPTDKNNFGPRFGFAYQVASNTVVRGAYGIYYPPSALEAAGVPSGTLGFRGSTSSIFTADSMRTINTYLRDPFPAGFRFPPGRDGGATTQLGATVDRGIFDSWRNPYVQQWNLTVQRRVPGNFVLEIGYLGNRGIHLPDDDGGRSYNQLPPSYMAMGTDLLRVVSNPFYGVITDATSTLSRATVEYRQLLRPYPQYTGVSSLLTPTANSIYHGMMIRADRRFSRSFGMLLSYTTGKIIDDASTEADWLGPAVGTRLDAYNRRLERSVSSQDIAQRFVVSYMYELPFGKGKRFLSGLPRGANLLLSGWQLNGITSFQSGPPMIVFALSNNTQIYTTSQRPNNNGHSARLTGGTTDQRLARWFDTSVFSQPSSYTFGNTGRTLPDVRKPGKNTSDVSLFKNTFFGPERRLNLQYRMEMFGAFNTPQFSAPAGTVGSAGFGVISGASGARQIQMALKLIW